MNEQRYYYIRLRSHMILILSTLIVKKQIYRATSSSSVKEIVHPFYELSPTTYSILYIYIGISRPDNLQHGTIISHRINTNLLGFGKPLTDAGHNRVNSLDPFIK